MASNSQEDKTRIPQSNSPVTGLENLESNSPDSKSLLSYINCFTRTTAVLEKAKILSNALLIEAVKDRNIISPVVQDHFKMSLASLLPSLKGKYLKHTFDLIFKLIF